MQTWVLVFKAKKSTDGEMMPAGLKQDMASMLRLETSYVVNLSGIRLIGFEFNTQDDDFFHLTRLIRILEKRYRLTLFELSEKDLSPEHDVVRIKVGSRPVLQIA